MAILNFEDRAWIREFNEQGVAVIELFDSGVQGVKSYKYH